MHARSVPRFTARLVAAAFITLFAAACEHLPSEPGALATIVVSRNPDTLSVNTRRQFTAIGYDVNGAVVGINPTWSTASGGTVTTTGLFTAGATAGTFASAVRATVGSVTGAATVTVLSGNGSTITLTPATATLAIAGTQQYTVVAKDINGTVLAGTPVWSATLGVGTISQSGLFSAGNVAGTFPNAIVVSVAGLTATASVTITAGALATVSVSPNPAVLASGGVQVFTATGRDINGNTIAFTPVWSVQSGGGTIDSTGRFTAGATAGTYANTVRACNSAACTPGAIAGFSTVVVGAGALATLTVTPNPVDVGTGASTQFTATGRDVNGNIVPVVPAPTWTVQAGGAGGTISATGLYTAPTIPGVGFDTVRATSGAIVAAARANIRTAGALATIVVSPNPANVPTNGTQQFTAVGLDATGLVVPTPGLAWSTVNGSGAINVTTGAYTAGSVPGSFPNSIKATSGTVSGFASVVVGTFTVIAPSLGTASTYGALAGTSITCAGAPSSIGGDVGISPSATLTGFPPCTITGATHAGDAVALTAQSDLSAAYLAIAAQACTNTITADLGGQTLGGGVYCSATTASLNGVLTLTGTATTVFIIRASSTISTAGSVVMAGGALARNVYWWTGSSANVGTPPSGIFQGNILALTNITLGNTTPFTGRALTRNGTVALGTGTVITLP